MTNKEIAKQFDFIANLMELHDENPFKIRSYQNAYNVIRQNNEEISDLNFDQLIQIKGIGKSIATDILELFNSGEIKLLNELLAKTPEGLLDLLKIKGIGPKKIRALWLDLSISSLGELEYAIKENRLTLLKGFGSKIQDNILSQIEFLNANKGKILYFKAKFIADELIEKLRYNFPDRTFNITGDLRRQMPVIEKIEIISDLEFERLKSFDDPEYQIDKKIFFYKNTAVEFYYTETINFVKNLFETTGPEKFTRYFIFNNNKSEEDIFSSNFNSYIPPNMRDIDMIPQDIKNFELGKFISQDDIKGILHNHTIWSDGSDKLIDMALYYKELGYEYMLVSDHSKSAFYANGVKETDVYKYIEEIKDTNTKIQNFTVFTGIESDILADGNLDYNDDVLKMFDLVISSIHSGLNMENQKATERMLKAIENPYTRILGHMTGRILLAREGYHFDRDKVFDACAANKVAIELNCNPQRMDIDWTLISKAQDKGIEFCINPDAHSKYEVRYIDYGVTIAQKGGMWKEKCINAKNKNEFDKWIFLKK